MQSDTVIPAVSRSFGWQHISKAGITSYIHWISLNLQLLNISVPLHETEKCPGAFILSLRIKPITEDRPGKPDSRRQATDTLGGSYGKSCPNPLLTFPITTPQSCALLQTSITCPDRCGAVTITLVSPTSSFLYFLPVSTSGIDRIGSVFYCYQFSLPLCRQQTFQLGLPDKI